MYTVIRNVQVVISLLKEYGIKHLVLSPGSRNVPFVHSVENDPYFICYSVVDERSAGFFALGLSEELDVPVLVSCTSSTACSNYLPAIREAFEQGVQLIALTADRDPYFREQMENQMIMQPDMYGSYCKKSVDLPQVVNDNDMKYCERLVNEALLELNHGKKGPVQINFPAVANFRNFSVRNLPKCRVITRLEENTQAILWENKIAELKQYHKIMFLFGESAGYSDSIVGLLNRIFKKYNCMISVEHMSNLHCDGALRTFVITESISEDDIKIVLPDVVVTFGGNYASDFKYKLRSNGSKIRHWRVAKQGDVVDTFMALDTVFECSDEYFLSKLLEFSGSDMKNDLVYFNSWKIKIEKNVFPDLKFTNFFAISEFTKIIPANSILHLSILNSIRITQFFDINRTVRVFANLGAYGIDGSLSTFLGQAENKDELAFLIVGDLSFFYDLSATLMPHLSSNMRILLINNHGGGEFHYVYHGAGFNDIKRHIAAGHHSDAGVWINNLPMKYLCARNKKELESALKEFVAKESDQPIILETFTDIQMDSDILTSFYSMNRHYKTSTKIKRTIKFVDKGLRYVKKIIMQ